MVTKTRIILLLSFALVFAAGLAAGRLTARWRPDRRRGSWLTGELNLTPEQREQMQAIWSQVGGRSFREEWDRRRKLAQERDEAVQALLSEEQEQQYSRILQEHEHALAEMSEERRAAFEDAVARTKEMLTPKQRQQYEEMLTRMRERGGRRPYGRGPGPGRLRPPPPGAPAPGPPPPEAPPPGTDE